MLPTTRQLLLGGAKPLIDWDFTSGALDRQITFTRSSAGSRINAAGTLVSEGVNVPRFDHDFATLSPKGLLIEPARTNVLIQSEAIITTPWTYVQIVVAIPTRTADQAVAPDGTMTADKVDLPAVPSAGNASGIMQWTTLTAAGYVLSAWLKGAVGGEVVYLQTTPNGSTYYRIQITLTTSWQRFSVPWTATAATWYWSVGNDRRDTATVATPALTFYVWGVQVEAGAAVGSYIKTTTASVARSADSATIPSSLINTGVGTIIVDHDAPSGAVLLGDGATELLTSAGAGRSALAYDGSGTTTVHNGGMPSYGAPINIGAILRLLGSSAAQANAHISRFRYYGKKLS